MINRFNRLALAASVLAALVPAAASADIGSGDNYVARVESSDLNLSSKAGQATLAHRIDAAADKVCGYTGTVSLRDFTASAACRAGFEKAALGQANTLLAANGGGSSFAGASR